VCAYASNYPPVGEYTAEHEISFTGTPPYNLVLVSEGSGTRTYSINDNYYNLYEGETLQSFSDKTGASGTIIIKCHAPGATGVTFAAFNPCADAPYGSTYTLTDDRDKKQYKVKYMPDARYWMVQDLAFGEKCETKTSMANTSTAGNITDNGTYYGNCFKPNCNLDSYGYVYNNTGAMNYGVTSTTYTCSGTTAGTLTNAPSTCRGICPVGWHVPTTAEISSMSSLTISSALCTNAVEAIFTSCGFNNSPCEYWNDNNSTNISTSSGVIYYWWFDTAVEGTSNWSHPGFTRCTMNY
jgi:uncharacterized protein (TIGR02145 family)